MLAIFGSIHDGSSCLPCLALRAHVLLGEIYNITVQKGSSVAAYTPHPGSRVELSRYLTPMDQGPRSNEDLMIDWQNPCLVR